MSAWADYRESAFGEPYLVWHDGPDFFEFRSRFDRDPARATEMLTAGIAEGDPLAAQTPRELDLDEAQRARFVALLTEALPGADAGFRVEAGATLFALTGDAEWAAPVAEVLSVAPHWGPRINAALRLRSFPPTQDLVRTLATGVSDPEYLVRYHCANTLLAWAGRETLVSEDDALFSSILDTAGADQWAAAATRLAAAVTPTVEP
jgi:hypothetical protein